MTEETKASLDYIIDNKQVKTVFQPIISLRDGSVLGHEALSRITCESEIKNTEMLFTTAKSITDYGIWNCFAEEWHWKLLINL